MFTEISIVAYIALGLGILILAFVGLIWLNRLAISKGTHPVIRQFITSAIIQAYKLSDAVFDATDERLHSVQKREVALVVYDLLPDTFTILGFSFSWKKWMTREAFAAKISELYDEFTESFRALKVTVMDKMLKEIQELQT
jgi:hypothetical protein